MEGISGIGLVYRLAAGDKQQGFDNDQEIRWGSSKGPGVVAEGSGKFTRSHRKMEDEVSHRNENE